MIATEAVIRLGSFLFMLALMGAAESIWPRRHLVSTKSKRWFSNISIALISTMAARFLSPLMPAVLAIYCQERGLGLLNMANVPAALSFIIALLALDLTIYGQHVLFHKNRLLWRLHRMHHADLDIDTSTGIRFHPIEICLSMLVKLAAVLLIGPSPMAVITFEVILNACALFNHANVKLPLSLDRPLRLLLVTPDMHRVHHSTDMREANRNYGFNVPWWDRLFRTYKDQPDLGHTGMNIGLNIFRSQQDGTLAGLLFMPFK